MKIPGIVFQTTNGEVRSKPMFYFTDDEIDVHIIFRMHEIRKALGTRTSQTTLAEVAPYPPNVNVTKPKP
jgi:hypothetical protein